jgi:mannose-6-phosphate isomerase-like protein (cupin superfamily)
MQVLYKKQAKIVENSNECIVTEYKIDKDNHIDCALVSVKGRYPAAGNVINQKCKEMVYVYEGKGKIVIENIEVLINSGDAVLIEPGEKYYWEGNIYLFIACTPAWEPEQHILVD